MTDNETPEVEVDNTNAEAEVTDSGAGASSEAETSTDTGQGKEGTAESRTYKDYNTLVSEKGWDPKTANEQLIKSYQDLEGKLGNWKEVEQRAQEYQEFQEQYGDPNGLAEKAQAWDRAQNYIQEMQQNGQLKGENIDTSKLPTDRLAQLWQNGVIGLNDVPKERQFEVQRFVQAQQTAFEENVRQEATRLTEKYPILKDPKIRTLVANQIEAGLRDDNGKELTPDEIVEQVQSLVQQSEKKGEQRLKQETEKLKEGNLESSDSAAKTKPVTKVTSVKDAFDAAMREINEGV